MHCKKTPGAFGGESVLKMRVNLWEGRTMLRRELLSWRPIPGASVNKFGECFLLHYPK